MADLASEIAAGGTKRSRSPSPPPTSGAAPASDNVAAASKDGATEPVSTKVVKSSSIDQDAPPEKKQKRDADADAASANVPHTAQEAKPESTSTAPAASAPIPAVTEDDEEAAFNETMNGTATASASASTSQGERKHKKARDRADVKAGVERFRAKKAAGLGREGREAGKWKHDHFAPGPGAEGEGEGKKETGEAGGEGDEGEGKKRLPKKRVALQIGFCGTGYQGMQIQTDPNVKTIEGEVFQALVKAGAVSEENAESHRKVDVQRSARTDAGVHAAGNVISLKMIYDPPLPEGYTKLSDYVNSFLPDQIRMWGFVRTMKSFQARLACDSRVYEYLLPSYCLLPPASSDPICKRLNESSPGWRDGLGPGAAFADETPELPEVTEKGKLDPRHRGEYERRRAWRVDEGTMARFRALVDQFHGTHNFHNYTVGKPFNDRTVKRFMIKLEVREPVVHGDIEWISVRIHGQSFMLHQIRKMMSLAMLACRTGSPPSLLPETFGPKKIHIPKAPPLGLLLQKPMFKVYNDRIKHTDVAGNKKPRGAPKLEGEIEREPVEFEQYEDEMEAFKVKWIYERLRQDELETNVFHKWIRQVDCSSSAAYSFLNSQGIIPPEAAQGKHRAVGQNAKQGSSASKPGNEGAEEAKDEDMGVDESDDEDVDPEALRRGELEG